MLKKGISISEVEGGNLKEVEAGKRIGDEETRKLEKDVMTQIDVGILESITDKLNFVQVNLR